MRVQFRGNSFSPGDTVTGTVVGALKRRPRSMTVNLVIRETVKGQVNDRIMNSVTVPVPDGTSGISVPFAIVVPLTAVPGHKETKGQTEWGILASLDLAGPDKDVWGGITVRVDQPLTDVRQHPAFADAEHANGVQKQRLADMVSKPPPWLTYLLWVPSLVFVLLAFANGWFGLPLALLILIVVLLGLPGALVVAIFWITLKKPPSGITIQAPTVAIRGTSVVVSVTVNGSSPMVACFTSRLIATEWHGGGEGVRGREEERLYEIGEQCFDLNEGNNSLTVPIGRTLPATYNGEVVSFAHQVRVRNAPRLGLPSRFEPHVSKMVAVLS